MPALSNPKHERFAQALAKGKTADEAYILAGYSENRGNATRLKAKESVMKRLSELQDRGAIRAEVTLEDLIGHASRIMAAAEAEGQFAPAVSALKELGILTGKRVERRENTNRNVNDMSDDELAAIASGRSEGTASTPGGPPITH